MDPYEQYMMEQNSKLRGGQQLGADSSAASATGAGFPVAQAAGSGMEFAGQVLNGIGQYEQYQDQKKEMGINREHDWGRQAKADAASEEERKRRELMDYGSYADNSLEELLKDYGRYNASIGR